MPRRTRLADRARTRQGRCKDPEREPQAEELPPLGTLREVPNLGGDQLGGLWVRVRLRATRRSRLPAGGYVALVDVSQAGSTFYEVHAAGPARYSISRMRCTLATASSNEMKPP